MEWVSCASDFSGTKHSEECLTCQNNFASLFYHYHYYRAIKLIKDSKIFFDKITLLIFYSYLLYNTSISSIPQHLILNKKMATTPAKFKGCSHFSPLPMIRFSVSGITVQKRTRK